MKITKSEALSIAKALVLPPERMEEISRFCAKDGLNAMTMGLIGVYFALGDLLNQHPRLTDEGTFWPEDEKLSLEPYAGRIDAETAFAALDRHLGRRTPRQLTLLNTSIVTAEGTHELRRCALETAREMAKTAPAINSAIGHEATAQILTELLGVPVAVNRQAHVSKPGDVALVFKLKGRPPEGKILSREEMEAIGYEFFTLVHVAG